MQERPQPRRSPTPWLVAGSALLLLGGLATATLTHRGGAERRQRVEAFVRTWEARSASATTESFGPLWGETHDEDVSLARSALRPMLLSLRSSLAKLSGPDKVAERTAARSALAPIVALAQRLAHNGARVQWETGAVAGILRIAQADAWDRGAASEAVGYWLDEARMWRDGRFDGSKWPLSSVWPDDRVRRLDVAAARLLAAGLERLDATWPPHTDVVRFMAKHARGTLEGGWSAGRLRALRHGFFDPADAELAACDALIAGLPRMQPPRSGLVARMQQWGEWATHDGDWSWTAVGAQVDQLRLRESSHLLGITEVRLLRLALAFRLGEPLPELVDPISGGPFDVRIEGNVASFRSTANGDEQVRWAERPR